MPPAATFIHTWTTTLLSFASQKSLGLHFLWEEAGIWAPSLAMGETKLQSPPALNVPVNKAGLAGGLQHTTQGGKPPLHPTLSAMHLVSAWPSSMQSNQYISTTVCAHGQVPHHLTQGLVALQCQVMWHRISAWASMVCCATAGPDASIQACHSSQEQGNQRGSPAS